MTDYEPFGYEWEKEMMQMKKEDIVELYKDVCIRYQSTLAIVRRKQAAEMEGNNG